ncbi:MAG: C-type lectin domain-containing protein [Campylobacterales bacterium]|nr:C-type lectin domain-containing protein [Campylobacterales bacterium]
MKFFIGLLFIFITLQAGQQSHQADGKMVWQEAYRYCFSMGGRMASIKDFEKKFAEKKQGRNTGYDNDSYWTGNNLDIEGAYSFDFDLGLSIPDHKSKKLKVMCVK